MVIRSFLKCGILNSMDGTQDDALFDELTLSGSEASDNVFRVQGHKLGGDLGEIVALRAGTSS